MFWLSSKEGQGVNVLKPNQRATVITLLERNTPQREIARITGIDRKTIRSYHARWLLDPYTLKFNRSDRRHAMRWFVR